MSPFRDPSLPERIRQGNILSKRDDPGTAIGMDAGAAKAKAAAMKPWVLGDVGKDPELTSAPPPLIGGQPFSELRKANEGVFKEWGDRFFGGSNVGASFLPPPPEPAAEPTAPKEEA